MGESQLHRLIDGLQIPERTQDDCLKWLGAQVGVGLRLEPPHVHKIQYLDSVAEARG